MKVLVQKFGGTSLATVERLRSAAEIIKSACDAGYKVIAVASAMGDTTDDLLAMANQINPSDKKHTARDLDMLLSTGEQQAAALLSLALNRLGQKSVAFTGAQAGILTDRFHGSANIKKVQTKNLHNCLRQDEVAVVTGYQGVSDQGEITTLGRGGSDTTAVALAAAMHAECCEIYTDVDGVYSADPRLFKNPFKLTKVSYEQMLTLASAGAQVMCARSMEIARRTNTIVQVRSVFKLDDQGTMVGDNKYAMPFAGVACEKEEVFALGPAESIADLQPIGLLVRQLRESGVPCELVRPLTKRADNQVFLATTKRHVHDTDTLIHLLADPLKLAVEKKAQLSKVSIVGAFENKKGALQKALNVLLPGSIKPLYWTGQGNARISFLMPSPCQTQAIELLHQEFHCTNQLSTESFSATA